MCLRRSRATASERALVRAKNVKKNLVIVDIKVEIVMKMGETYGALSCNIMFDVSIYTERDKSIYSRSSRYL